ncbi:MAG: FixH family protein [Polyangiaceae bacterium]
MTLTPCTPVSQPQPIADHCGASPPSIGKLSVRAAIRGPMTAAALCAWGLLPACASSPGLASDQSSVSSQDAVVAPVPSPDPTPVCDTKFNPSTLEPGLTQPSSSGAFTFVLVDADSPPRVEYNTWTVRVIDASGKPVTDATFPEIKTWMPLHGHPSSVLPTYTSNGDGTYTIKLYLFMPGLWQVTPTVQTGATTDQAVFTFCVGG